MSDQFVVCGFTVHPCTRTGCSPACAARGVRFPAVEGAYITGHALNLNGGSARVCS